MSHLPRRGAMLAAALTLALAPLVLAAAPVDAAPPAGAATVIPSVGCGSALKPCLSLRDVVCWEDNWCLVPVNITPYAAQPIRITYTSHDSTATAGENYRPAEGIITIPPRSASAVVPVFVVSSRTSTGEPATFTVTLSEPTSGVLVTDTATVTIVPRDANGAPTVGDRA